MIVRLCPTCGKELRALHRLRKYHPGCQPSRHRWKARRERLQMDRDAARVERVYQAALATQRQQRRKAA